MGRGRAKAKQTRVARDLKYRPVDTDFASLERELRGDTYNGGEPSEIPDAYVEYEGDDVDEYDDEEDEDADEAYVPRR